MTMQALEFVCSEVVNVLRTVDGIDQVPLNPTSVQSCTTFGLVYPNSGTTEATPTGTRRSMHVIAIDLLTKNIDIARAMAQLKPFVDTVSLACLQQVSYDSDGNPGSQFNGSMETFGSISYSWLSS